MRGGEANTLGYHSIFKFSPGDNPFSSSHPEGQEAAVAQPPPPVHSAPEQANQDIEVVEEVHQQPPSLVLSTSEQGAESDVHSSHHSSPLETARELSREVHRVRNTVDR